jgi:hypothetical protein
MVLQFPPALRPPTECDASTEIEVACDWLEASVLFSGASISKPEASDLLKDESIFPDASTAAVFIDDVWRQLRSRRIQQGCSGPFAFDYQRMSLHLQHWEEAPAHAFLLLLSHPFAKSLPLKRVLGKRMGPDYTVQGDLFERLVEAACVVLWPTWTVHKTGWSTTKPQHLPAVVEDVARKLCGKVGNLTRWSTPGSKERGLDLLWFREFGDRRGCFPAFLMQCASGRNFERKLDSPNEGLWQDILDLVPRSLPRKAFASPFSFGTSEFERNAIQGKCLLLDRMRLLSAAKLNPNWLPSALATELVSWVRPRSKRLLWRDN